nr:zinc finger and SCAN domain-containing protein 4 [Vulpes vulpes]
MLCVDSFLGDKDKANGDNIYHNDGITSQGNAIPSLFIVHEEDCPQPEEDSISLKNLLSPGRAGLGTSKSQEGSLQGHPYQDVLMEGAPGFHSRSPQSPLTLFSIHQRTVLNSTCGGPQERFCEAQNSYRCEKCPRIFRYFSQLKAHQRRHNNERTFIYAESNKGFFQASDLYVHQKIHAKEKPFRCSTCEKSFSHKTNLLAHERIHTGEKPYVCALCQRSYRQSSTYHRHLRTHQKIAVKGTPSTSEASSAVLNSLEGKVALRSDPVPKHTLITRRKPQLGEDSQGTGPRLRWDLAYKNWGPGTLVHTGFLGENLVSSVQGDCASRCSHDLHLGRMVTTGPGPEGPVPENDIGDLQIPGLTGCCSSTQGPNRKCHLEDSSLTSDMKDGQHLSPRADGVLLWCTHSCLLGHSTQQTLRRLTLPLQAV